MSKKAKGDSKSSSGRLSNPTDQQIFHGSSARFGELNMRELEADAVYDPGDISTSKPARKTSSKNSKKITDG